MAHPLHSVLRAILGGLTLGALAAAIVFAAAAWNNSHRDCEFPGTEQCTFERSTALGVARLQAFAAIGCALIAGGLYLGYRRQ